MISKKQNFLEPYIFETVISSVPLVSVDLVIENTQNKFLMGLRKNRPAQGHWFVPGGRIMKEETIREAISRVLLTEIGYDLDNAQVEEIGSFDHIYKDSIFSDDGKVSTHYVALGFHINLDNAPKITQGDGQHAELRWFSTKEIFDNEKVHEYSRDYIRKIIKT